MSERCLPHLSVLDVPDVLCGRAPTRRELTCLAQQLAACPEMWADHIAHDPDHRVHRRLAALPAWEAWLITWPSGQRVEMHDHGGSAGAIAVVAGELVEVIASPWSSRRVRRVTLPAGTVRSIGRRTVHDVINASATPAVSLHLYGPALSSMSFYDDDRGVTRVEVTFPELPLLRPGEVVVGMAEAARRGRGARSVPALRGSTP